MNETLTESGMSKRSFWSRNGRILFGLVLLAMGCGAASLVLRNWRERWIHDDIVNVDRQSAQLNYCGPRWLSRTIRRSIPVFDCVTVVFLNAPVPESIVHEALSLRYLKRLSTDGIVITDSELAKVKGMNRLIALSIQEPSRDVPKVSDAGLENLKDLTQLTRLTLVSTNVSGEGLRHLSKMTQLKTLKLDFSPVTDAGLEYLKGLSTLEELDLDSTRLTDSGLSDLIGLSHLQKLVLRRTRVSDHGLSHLEKIRSLKYISLLETKTTPAGRTVLRHALPNCEVLPEP